MVKIQPFSPIFPLADSMAEIFFGYLFEISRNKVSIASCDTAKQKNGKYNIFEYLIYAPSFDASPQMYTIIIGNA
jgi:hypothetical protein